MEDFFYAGGVRALMNEIRDLLDVAAGTIDGQTLGQRLDGARVFADRVILPRERPLSGDGGLTVLRGNLGPDGAVIKHAAADRRLWRHTGPAVVFRDYNDLMTRIDAPGLQVTADSVLVLQHAGPVGGPGMPEWGMLPIPKKLLTEGVRDMVRISDARMSGTAYGACVLHVAPESFIGGPLALVREGDRRTPSIRAATGGCTRGTSCRRTRAAISISSRCAATSRSRKFIDDFRSAIAELLRQLPAKSAITRSPDRQCSCYSLRAFRRRF
jgi:dihydroxyacid dehydratase/phosphogluconate dehydratase